MTILSERLKDLIKNPFLIPTYAKRKCKVCQGRGIEERDIDIGFGRFDHHRIICECVKQALSKEIKENANVGQNLDKCSKGCGAKEPRL